jgi:hypothetical protein
MKTELAELTAEVAQASKPAVSQVSKPASLKHVRRVADLEVGDTAGLEACATKFGSARVPLAMIYWDQRQSHDE